jgi:hypothetical protein
MSDRDPYESNAAAPAPAANTASADAADAAKLAEVRAKRAALDAARADAEAARAVKETLAREVQALADAEGLAAAEAQYGPEGDRIRSLDAPNGALIIVKRAGNAAFRRFMDLPKATTDDAEKLVRPCVVYPGRAEFDLLVEAYPALWLRLAGALTKLAGFKASELAEK